MARFSNTFWLDRNYYRLGYVDDIYEAPFSFDYFLKVDGGDKDIIEYNDDQFVYTRQNISYYCNGVKQWATKPKKPAKEYYLKESSCAIVIGNRCLFPGMQKLVCFDLESQEVLWEINDPGKKSIEDKFKIDLSYRSNYESFNWPIWFDEKHIYFRCYAGYIIKVDYLNGSIVDLLDFYYLGVTNEFKGLLIGEMKKFNNEKKRLIIYNLSKEKVIFDLEVESYSILSKGDNFIYNDLIISNDGYQRYCHQITDNISLKWEKRIELSYLCADKENIFYYRDKKLICVDMLTGNTIWEKIYPEYDFRSSVDPNNCFVDNKYIHGFFRSCGHVVIDKKSGEIVYFVGFVDDRKWRMADRKGEITNDINVNRDPYYSCQNMTPGRKHIYYSLFEEGEYIRVTPSNKKD